MLGDEDGAQVIAEDWGIIMHMESALLSAVVGGGLLAAAGVVTGQTVHAVRLEEKKTGLPLVAAAGAVVFAAQMMNFRIPGLEASGHIVGGILLAVLLGSRLGYLTLASVLALQCLMFGDGGLLALGANILNMGALSCLVAVPLIYRPIAKDGASPWRVVLGAMAASTAGLTMGSLAVVLETTLSGNSALPFAQFMTNMLPIHLAIGLTEGALTGLALLAIKALSGHNGQKTGRAIVALGVTALLTAGVLFAFASSFPDGLEWSVQNVAGVGAQFSTPQGLSATLSNVQKLTVVMPEYSLAGAPAALPGLVGVLLSAGLGLLVGGLPRGTRRRAAI